MRLSIYKVAIDNGVSKPRAASIAKNISVNLFYEQDEASCNSALLAFHDDSSVL